MKFTYGKQSLLNQERGQEVCYLLTNGKGGYSSLTAIGSCSRSDHALFMAAETAPCGRFCLIAEMDECVTMKEAQYRFCAQEYLAETGGAAGAGCQGHAGETGGAAGAGCQNHAGEITGGGIRKIAGEDGWRYLEYFKKEHFPVWQYEVSGVEVVKDLVMVYGKNELAVRYQITNDTDETIQFSVIPELRFAEKGEQPERGQTFETTFDSVRSVNRTMYFQTNGKVNIFQEPIRKENRYYGYDARDGRRDTGRMISTHSVELQVSGHERKELYLLYSFNFKENAPDLAEYVNSLFAGERERLEKIRKEAGFASEIAGQLVESADAYIVDRESTGEKTIIAGYPFFGDWGRDTMIALNGLCLATGRFEETRSIFRSFMKYCHKGIMPNMFPESGEKPLYNTVDASLLFINAVYEYYRKTEDGAFLREAWETMQGIISWYMKGTDYHIRMDEDGLLLSGAGLEQVTWMDVRYQDILPTPRHGKAVEINAWWYNALCMMHEFSKILEEDGRIYQETAARVKKSYQEVFWNEAENCLKDTVSGGKGDLQIRCNQIWAVSAPFSILDREQEKAVVEKVYRELYTGAGLRTLDRKDPDFHPVYQGSMFERDMAYHQGTVWVFPLGAYYLAYLKVNESSDEAKARVRRQLRCMEDALREGCCGQLPEIYDGERPTVSRGCFAQAWSVGEMLRVYEALESGI